MVLGDQKSDDVSTFIWPPPMVNRVLRGQTDQYNFLWQPLFITKDLENFEFELVIDARKYVRKKIFKFEGVRNYPISTLIPLTLLGFFIVPMHETGDYQAKFREGEEER